MGVNYYYKHLSSILLIPEKIRQYHVLKHKVVNLLHKLKRLHGTSEELFNSHLKEFKW